MPRLLVVSLLLFAPAAHGSERHTREPLTIMTFNIRYGTADDGVNQWSARREHLFELIRREDADLIGLQEALDFQIVTAGTPGFVDTFRVLHADEREAGTFTGFKFGNTRGDKIDYVLVQPGTDVLRAEIPRDSRQGRYPSDHFPVVARVRLAPAP